jgi:hypothetical protein
VSHVDMLGIGSIANNNASAAGDPTCEVPSHIRASCVGSPEMAVESRATIKELRR